MGLCDHQSTLILEHFYHATGVSLALASCLPALDNYLSVFSIDLSLLDISEAHKICVFLFHPSLTFLNMDLFSMLASKQQTHLGGIFQKSDDFKN